MTVTIIGEDRDVMGITVEIERTIRVGQVLRINPSEAYLGIESGIIEVMAIGKRDDLVDHVQDDALEFTRIHLDMYDEDSAEYQDASDRLDTQPWIVYQYRYIDDIDTYVLPLEEFIEHSMMY